MNVLKKFKTRSATVVEVFAFLWQRKLWWLIPLAVLIVLVGILFVAAQTSPLSPFMYPL